MTTVNDLDVLAHVRAGFDSGLTRPLTWRLEQLDALARLIQEGGEQLERALWEDLRKSATEVRFTETGAVLGEVKRARKMLTRWLRPRRLSLPLMMRPGRARLVPEPLGVSLIIAPWNYPVNLMFSPLIGAIAAGNAAVLKPSELAPHVSAAIADLVPRYLDQRAFCVVEGGVDETTDLLSHRFDHIFYTGNARVARIIAAAAARNLTPLTLELGGKSPVWFDDAARIDQAARRIAWAKWTNAGQTCVAPDYVLTPPELVEPFIEAIRRATIAMFGADAAASPDYGRIVSTRHHVRLVSCLDDVDIAFGGSHDAGTLFMEPTAVRFGSLDGVRDLPVMAEEIFGPILPVLAAPTLAAAIDFVNQGEKPLALYVFSSASATRELFIERTSSGAVGLDVAMIQAGTDGVPFGGVGESGQGAYRFESSIAAFSHFKPVVSKPYALDTLKFVMPPFTGNKKKIAAGMAGRSTN